MSGTSKVTDAVYKYLEVEIQRALDDIQNNIDTMVDSRGFARKGKGLLNRGVLGENPEPVKQRKSGYVIATIRMANYWKYVDKGLRGRKWSYAASSSSPYQMKKDPPIDKIRLWMRDKGIVPRNSDGSRKKFSEEETLNLAYIIARKIRDYGVEAVPFYSSVINIEFNKKIFEGLNRVAEPGIKNDVDNLFRKHAATVTTDSNGNIIVTVK